MREFDYKTLPGKLLTPEICNLLASLHEYRGKQEFFTRAKQDVLDTLQEVAVIQSTDASNRIEGIFTSNLRLKKLAERKIEPATRNEEEIAGYRNVLATIHENYPYIPVTPEVILQLHRDLCSFQAGGIGGHWKSTDNVIAETDAAGGRFTRFTPVPAIETPDAVAGLCRSYADAVRQGTYDALLLTVLFLFDFLCIHPFRDGNGRMSRLLNLLLLYQNGYIVGKYISIEQLIESTKTSYYEALRKSSIQWESGQNDYLPFLRYMLGVILKAYREFESRITCVLHGKMTKHERIRLLFEQHIGQLSKADIAAQCPDISIATIELTLKKLQECGFLRKIGRGKNTAYVKRSGK